MAQITVTIDGKAYRMACEEGQEDHLTKLADKLDRYVGHLKGQFGEIGDLRITVMAGIMIMDELSEMTRKVGALEAEIATLQTSRDGSVEVRNQADQVLVATIAELTERIAGLAAKLNARQPVEAG
jgi:cell division protein ZapA